ncbi:hypothetical protein [Nocardia sp. NPDC004604]|uniref:hypothetical protein n=1 Tax=Nocardia sp. NPDC004604 TaxID=3157013 RepID=UPI0033A3D09A
MVNGESAPPYWWRPARSDHPGDRRRFYQQIGDSGLISGTPERNAPLLEWIHEHRDRRSIDDLHGEHLIEWLDM